MPKTVFAPTALLLPQTEAREKWPVIACDQFTSQPEYWQRVRALVGTAPSALELIVPEAELGTDLPERLARIHRRMEEELAAGLFREYPGSFVYVERTLLDGGVRRGLVGAVDLEAYDYADQSRAAVRATEKTVVERIPPRQALRRGAALELSHVLLLCDDERRELIEPLTALCTARSPLYDLELMLGGGRVRGWLLDGDDAAALQGRIADYEARRLAAGETTLYAVGDGNHSLASAKACWEERKAARPGVDLSEDPARWAMVELENLRDELQVFEPIHRLVTGLDPDRLLTLLAQRCPPEGLPLPWFAGERAGRLYLRESADETAVGQLQTLLDELVPPLGGTLDYIHGDEALRQLAGADNAVGFLLPPLDKASLLRSIGSRGVLPRKAFSIGHAQEKRYYLEARRIK